LLLHVAGEEVQDIIETLDNTGTKYDQAVAALSDYFKPRKHISFERRVFRHAKQKEDETIDNFIVRLSKLSVSCEYDRFVLSPSTLNELGARRSKFPAILKKLSTNCQIVEFNHSFEYRNLIHF
jgi:hypothetical protein